MQGIGTTGSSHPFLLDIGTTSAAVAGQCRSICPAANLQIEFHLTKSRRNSAGNASSTNVQLFQGRETFKFTRNGTRQIGIQGNIQYLQLVQQSQFGGQDSRQQIFKDIETNQIVQKSNRGGDRSTQAKKGWTIGYGIGIQTKFDQGGHFSNTVGNAATEKVVGEIQDFQFGQRG